MNSDLAKLRAENEALRAQLAAAEESLRALRRTAGLVVESNGITPPPTSAEAALQESNQRYQTLTEIVPTAIFVNRNNRIVYVNPECVKLLGAASPEEILERPDFDFLHPDYHAVVRERIAAVRSEAQAVPRLEEKFIRLDGRVIDVEVAAAAFQENGEPSILVTLRDITEQKRAEARLRASEAQLQTLTRAVPSILWSATPDGLISFHNEQWLTYTGLTPEQNERDWLSLVAHPNDYERCVNAWYHALATGEELSVEVRNRRHDGQYRWFLTRAVPLHDDQGKIISWVGSTTDIHDRKQIEEELQLANYRFRLAEEAARGFSYEWDLCADTVTRSEGIRNVLGYDADELAPTWEAWAQLLHPDDLPTTKAESIAFLNRFPIETHEAEYRIRRKDGTYAWLYERALVLRDEAGRATRLIGQTMDITERKEAEAQRQKFVSLVENSSDFIATCDVNFHLDYANRAALQMLGIKDRAAGAQIPFEDYFFTEDWSFITQEFLPRVLHEGRAETEIRLRNMQTGAGVWMLYNLFKIRDEQGNSIGLASVSKNITERKRRENNQALLAQITSDFARLSTPTDIMQTVGERLGRFLQVPYCTFMAIDETRDEVLFWDRWNTPDVPRLPDSIQLSAHVSEAFIHQMQAAEMVVSHNTQTNSITKGEENARIGALAFIAIPFHKEGEWKYAFSVSDIQPREWRADEIELVHEVANRLFPRLERARAEEAQRKSEEQLRLVTDAMPTLISYVDADCRYQIVNRTYTEWFGSRREEMLGKTMLEVLGEAAYEILRPHIESALAGNVEDFETIAPYKQGVRYIRAIYTPDFAPDGTVRGIFVLVLDTSAQKAAEEKLRQTEYRLRAFAENVDAEIWIADAVTREKLYVSQGFEKIFGYPLAQREATPLGWIEHVHPDDRSRVEQSYQDAVATEGFDLQYRVLRPDGRLVWVRDRCFPVRDEAGRVMHLAGIANDITDDKKAEEDLARLAAIVSSSYDAILSKTTEGIITSWNASAERMFGYRAEEILQQSILRLIPPELHAEENHILARLRRGESIEHYESVRVTKDGRRLAVSLTISPLKDSTGKIIGASKIIRDITERKDAEAQLREAQRFTQSIIEATPSLTYIYDIVTSSNIFISQQSLAVLGYTVEELQAMQSMLLSNLLHTDDIPNTKERFAQLQSDRLDRIFEVEYRMRRKDGEWVWLFDRTRVFLRAADGTPLQVLGVATDITARKKIEEKLREAEERQRLALESGEMGAWVWDIKNKQAVVDDRTLALFGVPQEDYHGDPEALFERILPADRPLWETSVTDAIRNHAPYQAEFRVLRSDGQLRWLAGHGRTEYDVQGNALVMRGITFDITTRKQNETERERLLAEEHRAREVAEAATRSKDEFLAVVSHELRNPLNAILGYTRLIRAHPHDPDKVLHNTEIIHRNAKVQQQLIEDLLDTARIISGKLAIEAAPTDLRLVLEEVLNVVRPAAAARKIDLVGRLGNDPQIIIGDAMRLQQVAWNLLQNAIKFTPEGGYVELRLEQDAQQVTFAVLDTGKGIEPEFLPAVFDRFSQNDMSRTRRHGGLGLGLALTKQLVEMHGGTIEVISSGLGLGATFTVRLPHHALPPLSYQLPPRAIAEVRTDEDAIPLKDLPRLDQIRVLIVDDQEEARLMLATTLQEWGAIVTTAASGAAARALVAVQGFDVLVCDIAMPDEDGYQVLEKIRELEQQRRLPLSQYLSAIALTARARPEDRLQALSAGYQMHIAKPVELAELIVVIHALVHNRTRET